MKFPKWKKRQLEAKAELEAAERKARHDAFWAVVDPPRKLIEDQPDYSEPKPVDYERLPV